MTFKEWWQESQGHESDKWLARNAWNAAIEAAREMMQLEVESDHTTEFTIARAAIWRLQG